MFVEDTDAVGRHIVLEDAPRRIVSLVPSQTELLADLGLEDETVGLTRFCVHPDGWKQSKAIVGGTKNVDVEKVRALRADLVIANKEENVREQVEAIAAFAPVWTTDVATVADSLIMIRDVGRVTGRVLEAERIAAEVEAGFSDLEAETRDLEAVSALYLIWREPWMSVGRDTIIADVLRRGGFASVTDDRDRYPALEDEEIAALAPDVVLLSSEPYPFAETHIEEVQALVPDAEIRLVDGEPFSWYGSRLRTTPGALRDLRRRLA
ncbi:helical backbone metal receptor [Rubrivirga sp.]|uniref:helical backbone metal receptor n=1 Tax=Rubrivirga sp. TaxID=1885344 RepID=UPI003C7821FC